MALASSAALIQLRRDPDNVRSVISYCEPLYAAPRPQGHDRGSAFKLSQDYLVDGSKSVGTHVIDAAVDVVESVRLTNERLQRINNTVASRFVRAMLDDWHVRGSRC